MSENFARHLSAGMFENLSVWKATKLLKSSVWIAAGYAQSYTNLCTYQWYTIHTYAINSILLDRRITKFIKWNQLLCFVDFYSKGAEKNKQNLINLYKKICLEMLIEVGTGKDVQFKEVSVGS